LVQQLVAYLREELPKLAQAKSDAAKLGAALNGAHPPEAEAIDFVPSAGVAV
jgi:hypothetical protein